MWKRNKEIPENIKEIFSRKNRSMISSILLNPTKEKDTFEIRVLIKKEFQFLEKQHKFIEIDKETQKINRFSQDIFTFTLKSNNQGVEILKYLLHF